MSLESLTGFSSFFEAAGEAGWHVRIRDKPSLHLSGAVGERYPRLPEAYRAFLASVVQCTNEDQTAWFLCEEDYNGQSDAAFQWNEWEQQSLEAVEGNEAGESQVRRFWDNHFPIFLSVKSGYAYLAICVSETDYGAVVSGSEPEYEEVRKIANSFQDFIEQLTHSLKQEQTLASLAGLF